MKTQLGRQISGIHGALKKHHSTAKVVTTHNEETFCDLADVFMQIVTRHFGEHTTRTHYKAVARSKRVGKLIKDHMPHSHRYRAPSLPS